MLVDTGANVTLLRTHLARKLKERLIYTASNISLNTATGEKAEIHAKSPRKVSLQLKREAVPVRVLNLKNKPKIVDKGDIIATCEPVVDIFACPQESSEAQHLLPILENLEILNEEQ
ncbi:hypothetical protein AVEN_268606-1 [Araneus ventricosus]|uniref:Peptidase A2 domain-containing protein n=1 Tax=Araneus ventricosus TaxID=182803 RepID=A0A4Y2H072_ARAVE|nr:hypothetical protein AVEN_268606-1 [Araneus ventricosus]